MAEGLPEGLVKNREGITAVEEGSDEIDIELLRRCWRVYSGSRVVIADNVGRRLENFFWRIWSSERVRQRLGGTQVNAQFDVINEGGYIRTTPTASPQSTKGLTAYYKEARRRQSPLESPTSESSKQPALPTGSKSRSSAGSAANETRSDSPLSRPSLSRDDTITPRNAPLVSEKIRRIREVREGAKTSTPVDPEDSSVTPTPISPIAALDKSAQSSKESRRTHQIPPRPPPILKKEGSSGSTRASKTAKIALSLTGEPQVSEVSEDVKPASADDDSSARPRKLSRAPERSTTTRFSEEVEVSPKSGMLQNVRQRSTQPGMESSQKSGKRNPVVVATTAANRTRPAYSRSKSSATSSKNVLSKSLSNQHLARSPKTLSSSLSAGSRSISGSKQTLNPLTSSRTRAASPHHSRQQKEPSPEEPSVTEHTQIEDPFRNEARQLKEAPTATSTSTKLHSSWPSTIESSGQVMPSVKPLVDPDFRAKFIDRTRASQRSLTNLSAFARKSSAAVPTSASYQASGMIQNTQTTSSTGRGNGQETFTHVTGTPEPSASAGPEAQPEDTPAPLPRTKSHLTLLIERDRDRDRKARRPDPADPNNL
ncbi:hypothetical protein ACLMJK_003041 [Lecanora helva]